MASRRRTWSGERSPEAVSDSRQDSRTSSPSLLRGPSGAPEPPRFLRGATTHWTLPTSDRAGKVATARERSSSWWVKHRPSVPVSRLSQLPPSRSEAPTHAASLVRPSGDAPFCTSRATRFTAVRLMHHAPQSTTREKWVQADELARRLVLVVQSAGHHGDDVRSTNDADQPIVLDHGERIPPSV